MPSDLSSEFVRWFQNMQRVLDRLAEREEHQNQLHAAVARLLLENKELREEMEDLRNMAIRLTNQHAETAQTLRDLAAYVSGVKDQMLRQSGEGT